MSKPQPDIRVVIADDHPIFRRGLKEVIESDSGLKVVGEAGDGDQAIGLIESLKPDVAVIDIDMPGKNGFGLAKYIQEKKLPVTVIFLTMYKDQDALDRALQYGAKGYVMKDNAATEVIAGIKAAARGEHYISPSLSSLLVNRASRAGALSEQQPELKSLTPSEMRVLKLIAEKKTSKEIAQELFVSPRTVDNHRASICMKLKLQGSNALLKFALDHKAELI
jgi:DNA-binding NarL/FixJ family response regulator